jgi:hypothetical protein
MVNVWILIHREGVVLNRRRRYRKDDSVGTFLQCAGINSEDASEQMYYYVSNVMEKKSGRERGRHHDEFFANTVAFAVDVDGAAGSVDHAC